MRRSVAHRNCASPVRASAQNGDLFFVTNNVFKFAKAHGTSQGEQDKKPEHGSKRAGMAELLDGPPKPRFYEAVTVTEL
ncbi:TPA: hypothetical protein ACH3X2_007676 [Trebouxia sp. C0005]